ncbi:MAG TPA: toll/interleukin-1 receptor domain-containing protein [Vitreimonas sp.]|uniref:toll/interleukin-1 receptor domain-containing protein n=1 Tax=Vitreimonas sp. TaxID=3069702 RepID=UPI002D237CCE|nr:toll/interleukin-1 receptor domain-containing protein [Vitreimonas sp.]HYD89379.1 toll/interleukin-1 receptor domain-containing protein [Vitreimonas sp.]
MADVFLSYAREDAARARQVAEGLERAGLDVFWDNEIPPGTTWADYIELKLSQCKALIVLWSAQSTKSQSVREEARLGRDKGVLIPVLLDGTQPPFGFGEVQAADLTAWHGDQNDVNWRRVVDAVSRVATGQPVPRPFTMQPPQAPPPVAHAPMPAAQTKSGPPAWVWIVGVVAGVFVLGAGAFMMQPAPLPPQQIAETMPIQPVAATPSQAPAVTDYQQQILGRLAQVEQAFVAQGYQQLAPPVSGQLPQGQYANVPATLQVGMEYRIIGVCDNDCGDFDLILYDENNNAVSQDNLQDATPVVAVAPQWSGPFTVQAVMHNCTVSPCYYALVLYGRPMQ